MTTKLFTEVDAKAAQQLLDAPTPPLLIDVREQNEWDAGYLHGATHAPKGTISFTIANIVRPLLQRRSLDSATRISPQWRAASTDGAPRAFQLWRPQR